MLAACRSVERAQQSMVQCLREFDRSAGLYLSPITFTDSDSQLLWICDPQQVSDTAVKLRVIAFQWCIWVESGQRFRHVMAYSNPPLNLHLRQGGAISNYGGDPSSLAVYNAVLDGNSAYVGGAMWIGAYNNFPSLYLNLRFCVAGRTCVAAAAASAAPRN